MGNAAAHEACCQYDSSRGSDPAVFVASRVMGRLLTRYRQEWNFARRVSPWCADCDEIFPDAVAATSAFRTREDVMAAVNQLPETDRWLLVQIFWKDRGQNDLARELGISQPAISKRYRKIVRQLRCFLYECGAPPR
jgi:DNA-directed RNA polymerase specialized sigma subunit